MKTLLLILFFSLVAGLSFHNHHLYTDYSDNNHYSQSDYGHEILEQNCPACLSSSHKPISQTNSTEEKFTYNNFSYLELQELFLRDYLLFHSIASRAPPIT